MEPLSPDDLKRIATFSVVETLVFCKLGRGLTDKGLSVRIGEPAGVIAKAKTALYEKLGLSSLSDELAREAEVAKLCDRHYVMHEHLIGPRKIGYRDSAVVGDDGKALRPDKSLKKKTPPQPRPEKPQTPNIQLVFPAEPLFGDEVVKAIGNFSTRQRLLLWLAYKGFSNEGIAGNLDVAEIDVGLEFKEIYGLLGYRKLGGRTKRDFLVKEYMRYRQLNPTAQEPPM